MKLSNDQKKMLRGIALYVPTYIVGYILFSLLIFKRGIQWGDILVLLISGLVIAAVFAVFTILGARIPTRDDTPEKPKEN